MRKKILVVIFTLCLAVVAMTVMAFADTPESVTIGEYTLMDGASLSSNDGTATYSDGILYLNNFTFSNEFAGTAIYSTGDLTIQFSGTNSISANTYGIRMANGGSLSIVGSTDAALEITALVAISDDSGNVSIAGGNVVINATFYAIYAANGGNLTISDCTLIANSGSIVTEFTGAITISDSTISTVVGSAITSSGGSVYINGDVDITSGSGISAPSGVIYITPTSGSSLAIQVGTTTTYCSATTTISSTTETVTIKAHTHTTEIQNAKDATCTEDGYTGDEVCTVCGETVTAGEVISATGHNYVDHVCTGCGELDCIAFGTDWVLEFDGTLTISSDAGMSGWTNNGRSTYSSRVISVVIESGVTSICDQAFYNCTKLTSVSIPDGVTSIGYRAFAFCEKLSSITIPDGVTLIGQVAFSNCKSLTSITIPSSVETIEHSAFYNCSRVETVTFDSNSVLETINNDTFNNCWSLTSITIPSSVKNIGSTAFCNCTSLAIVTIESCATTIADSAFSNTPALANDNIIVNHTTEIQNAKDATCGEDGYTGDEVCTVCGETITSGTVIAATGNHTYDSGIVTKEATCTEAGEMTYTCTVCGDTYTEAIAATGHSMAHYEAVDAECTTEGNIEYWYCTTCEKYFSDEDGTVEISLSDTIIPATGNHTTEIQNAKDATCTEDGYTGDEVCTVCGETITAGEVIPATGHTLTHYEAVEATCTTEGNIEYWYCSVCEKYFSDEDCTTEITLEDTVVAATDSHTYKAIVTDPTCTEKGYTTYICTECGDNYRDDYTDPAGHTAGTPVKENYVPVTATKDGYYELATYCTVCGEEISRSYTTIAAYGTNVRETIDWTAVFNAYANKTTTTVTIEEITITEPVEPTDTETEVDSGDEVTSEPTVETEEPETNPTTGMVLALMPMAMAMAVAVVNKKR